MSDQSEEIQKLLRLKRYESPPKDYFDDFLKEFQSRQRSELMRRSARSLLFERISTYFSDFASPRWIGATAGACAFALIAFIFMGAPNPESSGANSQQKFAGVGMLPPVDHPKLSKYDSPQTPLGLMFMDDFHRSSPDDILNYAVVELDKSGSDFRLLDQTDFAPGGRRSLEYNF